MENTTLSSMINNLITIDKYIQTETKKLNNIVEHIQLIQNNYQKCSNIINQTKKEILEHFDELDKQKNKKPTNSEISDLAIKLWYNSKKNMIDEVSFALIQDKIDAVNRKVKKLEEAGKKYNQNKLNNAIEEYKKIIPKDTLNRLWKKEPNELKNHFFEQAKDIFDILRREEIKIKIYDAFDEEAQNIYNSISNHVTQEQDYTDDYSSAEVINVLDVSIDESPLETIDVSSPNFLQNSFENNENLQQKVIEELKNRNKEDEDDKGLNGDIPEQDETKKLNHPTKNRPKHKNRKLPSKFPNNN